jgi:hypothetical protein
VAIFQATSSPKFCTHSLSPPIMNTMIDPSQPPTC